MPKKQTSKKHQKKAQADTKTSKESQPGFTTTSRPQTGPSTSKATSAHASNIREINKVLNKSRVEDYSKMLSKATKGNEVLREFCIKWSDRMAIGSYDQYIDVESKILFMHELNENLCWAESDRRRSELVPVQAYRDRIQQLTADYVHNIKLNQRSVHQQRAIEHGMANLEILQDDDEDD